MEFWMQSPAFAVYGLAVAALIAKMIVLAGVTAAVRATGGKVVNPEDRSAGWMEVVATDVPAVARWKRVHQNSIEAEVPFLLGGLLFVATEPSLGLTITLCGAFVAARFAHSVVYALGIQPARTIAFATGTLAMVALVGRIAWSATTILTA